MGEMMEFIIKLLREMGPLTTQQVEDHVRGAGKECPDGVARALITLKGKGLIEGKLDRKKGWIWWVSDDENEEKTSPC